MKKFFAIIMTICLMASALCVTTFAAESTDGFVITVSAEKEDGTVVKLEDYTSFEAGWNFAMEKAKDSNYLDNNDYVRIVVDLLTDWEADADGVFGDSDGEGFACSTICIPEKARVMLNMNGHTIDRGLEYHEWDGEVICIYENADVIINDGTIKGGKSFNGAGGIHIKDKANVILINVHIDGNSVRGDDGAAIAVYDGANLIMNGGSISNNSMRASTSFFDIEVSPYGALYANESTVTLNNVTLSDNYTFDSAAEGVAIYATESTVAINKCIVSGNAVAKEGRYNAKSVIAGYDSKFIITDTDFTNNASDGGDNCYGDSRLFYFEDSRLTMEGGKITQNNPQELLYFEDSDADINKVTITDNASVVIYVDNDSDSEKVNMNECTLNKNASIDNAPDIQVETKGTLAMNNCAIGDTNFEDKGKVEGVGSLFGEGSLTNILVIISLIASGVAIFLVVYYNKKKVAPVAANGATDTEADDEE